MRSVFLIGLFFIGLISPVHSQDLEECKDILHKGMNLIRAGEYPESLEYLTKAEVLSDQNKWYEENFIANNCMGIVYYHYSDYGEALDYYLKAYNIAMEHLDEEKEIAVINNIGAIYFDEGNYEKALYFHKRAYDIAKKINNREKIGMFALNMGNYYNGLDEPDKALIYINEAFEYIDEDRKLFLQNKVNLATNYLLREQADESIAILESIQEEAAHLDNRQIYHELLANLSEAYFKKGQVDEALELARQALKDNTDLAAVLRIYNLLSDYNFEAKAYKAALAYKDTVVIVSDSLSKIKNTRVFENNKIKVDIQNYKNELKNNQESLSRERILFLVALIVLLIISFLLYRLSKNRLYKEKQRKIIAEREQEILALELEKEKNEHLLLERQLHNVEMDALLEQERLKNEIEHKNRKLSSKALYLSGRNEMIEEVVESLNKLPAIRNNDLLRKQLSALREHLRTDTEWESFISHFEEVNQGFLLNLKNMHPDLNSNDIRFVCYIYMNLSTKEICSIFNITPEACRKRKARIAKKMEVSDGDTLYDYLSKLAG